MGIKNKNVAEIVEVKEVRYGQIWFIKARDINGNLQHGNRPVIIVSNDKNNLFSPTVNVIPLTSKLDKKKLPVHSNINSTIVTSISLAEQITTINKGDLLNCVGECSEEEIRQFKICLLIQLNLL